MPKVKLSSLMQIVVLYITLPLTGCAHTLGSGENDTGLTIGQDPVYTDQIATGTTRELDGHSLEYAYVTGSRYRLSFNDGYVSAKEIDSPRPQVIRAYLARKARTGQYLVHWMAQDPSGNDRKGHIALVLDFEQRKVYGTAVLPNGMQIFDYGTITTATIY